MNFVVLVTMWCSIISVLPGLTLRTSSNSSSKSFRLFRSFVIKCFPNVGVPTLSVVACCQVGTSSARTCLSACSAKLTPYGCQAGYHFFNILMWKTHFTFSMVIHINTVIHWAHLLNDRIRALPLNQELITICRQQYQYLVPNINLLMACITIIPCFLYLLCFS